MLFLEDKVSHQALGIPLHLNFVSSPSFTYLTSAREYLFYTLGNNQILRIDFVVQIVPALVTGALSIGSQVPLTYSIFFFLP